MEVPKEKQLIGKVTHFFTNLSVALIELSGALKVGEKISVEGATTNFEQNVDSMQIDRKDVPEAKSGDAIGIKVRERVRPGDNVYRV
jgi:translation elongation factor EF-1alpha